MKRIGIVTITVDGAYNLGNKLQTFALQEFLRTEGFEPEAIRYEADYIRSARIKPVRMDWKKMFSQPLAQSFDDICRILNRQFHKHELMQRQQNRMEEFASFDEKYISYTDKIYYSDSDYAPLIQHYDQFVTGSDQVWNPYYEGSDPFYYLQFAPQGKRVAYAPSIAVSSIPDNLKENIGQWIQEIDHVSIREEEGKALLLNEYGIEAKLVCDPVFLLDKEQWHRIATKTKNHEKYFAVYTLGKKTVQTKRLIRKLEKKFKISAVDILSVDDYRSAFAGPEAFLGWIENAEFVLTDSFHGAAFSVIFDRPMLVLERDSTHNMGSRIRNLLKIIDAGDRSAEHILEDPSSLPILELHADEKMKPFIQSSKEYLRAALAKQ